ncbi:hypothetical protein TVAG_112370 [Trichomonas vaginalis G3]|uniref:Uncharacterized protein n=1 Tax=Trichomonas vaginalis (strain ATCC PRA-98 / G3) TaxID=412133 RepID=A2G6V1_TRIV3|nr:hypothetical protein TVAGG3_0115590 [Trichomonas vaginalis G3]EAX87118.1 hypothetical protein TVAG_112370 [Trichomonas vaginalis G3]KAI5545153.1 hypothetical protein TVAGG3_0115590 [Trichomonas vaginalis G3]|eukprot:XP_001300048.1 hypothetical protein [Trichomonas vaginalis G3]
MERGQTTLDRWLQNNSKNRELLSKSSSSFRERYSIEQLQFEDNSGSNNIEVQQDFTAEEYEILKQYDQYENEGVMNEETSQQFEFTALDEEVEGNNDTGDNTL